MANEHILDKTNGHSAAAENLVITPEHAATGKMGGIGSYCADIDNISQSTIFLLVDDEVKDSPKSNILLTKQLVAELFPDLLGEYMNSENREYIIWLVTEWLVLHLPNLKNIDIYEYSGISARVAEAARSGLLPESVGVRVYCHGGHIQLERATGEWGGIDAIRVNNFERSCIENSNEAWFASDYLEHLYRNAGIKLDSDRTHKLGYPYHLEADGSKAARLSEITTLCFVGRLNRLKGFEIFVTVAEYVLQDTAARRKIKKVVVIGKDANEMPDERERLINICKEYGVEYIHQQLSRQDVQKFEQQNRHNTIFVLPYFSDNYSIAILELIEKSTPVLCLRTGGTPELVKVKEWQDRLASDAATLARRVVETIVLSPETRQESCAKIREAFISEQNKINEANMARISQPTQERLRLEGCRIYDIIVGQEDSMACRVDPATGTFSHQPKASNGYALLHIEGCSGLSDENRPALESAARLQYGSIYSCGYTTANSFVIPEYFDLGSLYLNSTTHIIPALLLPIDMLSSFLVAYREEMDVTIARTPEYFMLCLQSYLINRHCPVIPIPAVLVHLTAIVEPIVMDEAVFASLPAYWEEKNWQLYRYGALLRSIQSKTNHTPLVSVQTDESQAVTFDKMRLHQMIGHVAKRVSSIVRSKLK